VQCLLSTTPPPRTRGARTSSPAAPSPRGRTRSSCAAGRTCP
jgi:hypothetical protein